MIENYCNYLSDCFKYNIENNSIASRYITYNISCSFIGGNRNFLSLRILQIFASLMCTNNVNFSTRGMVYNITPYFHKELENIEIYRILCIE